MPLNKVNEHCRQKHNIRDADWVTAYRFTDNIGKVEMSLRACNVLENTKIPIWFGPALFKYDGVTFYQIVYKRPADVERRIEVRNPLLNYQLPRSYFNELSYVCLCNFLFSQSSSSQSKLNYLQTKHENTNTRSI